MLEPIHLPFPARLANAIGRLLRNLGLPVVPLEPEILKARAKGLTGLSDFGESEFEEGLGVLCQSANDDARLTLLGRLSMRDQISASLATRLRRIHLKKTRPEIFSAELIPPLIVLGLPRSGTTMLHRLLAMAPHTRAIKMWELREPIAPFSGKDDRRQKAVKMVKILKKLAPQLDAKHYIDVDEPEECVLLLDSTLKSLSFWMFAPTFSYVDWLVKQNMDDAYAVYREHLQIFQAETPGQRLILKAPAHAAYVDSLNKALPDAMVVHTVRDPEPVVGSVNSLLYTIHGVVTEKVDVARLGQTNIKIFRESMERAVQVLETAPKDIYYEVQYTRLVKEPVEVVGDLYRHFGLQFDPVFEAKLKEQMENRPQHKFGKHVYSLEECGITQEYLHEQMKQYYHSFLGGVPT